MLGKHLSRNQLLHMSGGASTTAAKCNKRVSDCGTLECPVECVCHYASWGHYFCAYDV
ncbi:hypothetical protein LX64_01325 [Chitinophaga skermanii]|uniref:Uncharacterized protein n=1 Tax=Chitinophaga skermanii TaxID=331697 RepID=A0A327QWG1_9BACT|nr:hypothetical protein LX64_01325 [Chitinophaga skermanii]